MYKQLYKEIIDNAKKQNRKKYQGCYYESHHIVPEFMFKNRKRKGPHGHLDGDPDSIDNLILLTFQEHLMAHYYLYEICKGTRYEFSAGSALQFFFVKAVGDHKRQINLSEVDQKFLNELAHLREIGIRSMSESKKGKMPAVDAVTGEKIGSVSTSHPKVLSGEWVHHSKGKKNTHMKRDMRGSKNSNYKEMTPERKERVFDCLGKSIIDECYLSVHTFEENIKMEFTEFKKISLVWIKNNFGSVQNLVDEYNQIRNKSIKYNPYYRNEAQRKHFSILYSGSKSKRSNIENGYKL